MNDYKKKKKKLWREWLALEDKWMESGYSTAIAKELRKLQKQIQKFLTCKDRQEAEEEMENFGLF
jgi:hypothetical protein